MPRISEQERFCAEAIADDWFPSPRVAPLWGEKNFRRMLEEMWEMPEAEVKVCLLEREKPLGQRFLEQAEKWERETAHLSSPLQRMMHPSYQAILGMGAEHKSEVTRLLLQDLQQNRRDWLLALSYLTQANPINPKDAGRVDKLICSWLNWGKEQGLL